MLPVVIQRCDVKTFVRVVLGLVAILVLSGIALTVWFKGQAKDDGGAGRPTYGSYAWPQAAAPAPGASGPGADDDPRARSMPHCRVAARCRAPTAT